MERTKPVKKGSFDELRVALGPRKRGKSTLALEWAIELSEVSYVLVHDPTGGFPQKLPEDSDDTRRVCRHKTLAEAVRHLEYSGAGIHSFSQPFDALPVLKEVEALAARSLRAGNGEQGIPVTLVFDEAVILGIGPSKKDIAEYIERFACTCRNLNLALIMTCQHSNVVNYKLISMATMVAVFRTDDEYALQKLKSAAVNMEALEQSKTLERFQYVLIDKSDYETVIEVHDVGDWFTIEEEVQNAAEQHAEKG